MNKHTYINQEQNNAAREELEKGKSFLLLAGCMLALAAAVSISIGRYASQEAPKPTTATVVIAVGK